MVASEYGLLTGFLLICVIVEGLVIKLLWLRNEFLGDKFLEIIPENTKVITQLVEKIDHLDDSKD